MLYFYVKKKIMADITRYVNSTMDEVHELCSELYEAMIDIDKDGVKSSIINLKKVLTDIMRTYETNATTEG